MHFRPSKIERALPEVGSVYEHRDSRRLVIEASGDADPAAPIVYVLYRKVQPFRRPIEWWRIRTVISSIDAWARFQRRATLVEHAGTKKGT